ncbi:uncharacterized protein LOC132210209 [Stegostoma tigrinum]|uniref:uncharacterized protein LOC132210209 n=1 Tax=Stegostoma tigrinum TaxID=3053191 RepID=UPI00287065FA|nr:uncharacterized protein LOC132210209 [Stegostoma tigrinum]
MDVQSLYTCISIADGLKALHFFLSRRPNQSPSTDTLIHLAKLILALNNFAFNSSHFQQTKGVAMDSCMDRSYACLFVGYVEQSLFHICTGPKPHLFLRYIDDCIGITSCSHKALEQFIHFTNTFHTNLRFIWTISDTSLSFLDLSVSISGNHLETDIHFKSITSHSYLEYTSSHPASCKNAIPYSQFLCLTASAPRMRHSTPEHLKNPHFSRTTASPLQWSRVPLTVSPACPATCPSHSLPAITTKRESPSSSRITPPASRSNALSSNTSTICNPTPPPNTLFPPHLCLVSRRTTLSGTPLSTSHFPPAPPTQHFSLQLQELLHLPLLLPPHPHPRPQEDFHIKQMFTCTSANVVYCICSTRCGFLYIRETKQRLGGRFAENLHSVCTKQLHLPVTNHFNSPSHLCPSWASCSATMMPPKVCKNSTSYSAWQHCSPMVSMWTSQA